MVPKQEVSASSENLLKMEAFFWGGGYPRPY